MAWQGLNRMNPPEATRLTMTSHPHPPHLREYINIMLRRRWFIVFMLLTTVMLVLCVTLRQVPTYKATATLRIQSQGGQASGSGMDLMSDAFGLRKAMELDTELRILKSRRVAEAAVRQLHYQLQLEPSHHGLLVLYRKLVSLLPASMTERPWLSLLRQPAFSFQVVDVGEITTPARYTLTVLEGGSFIVWRVEEKREIGRGAIGALFQGERFAFRLESQELQAGDKIAFTLLPFLQAVKLFQSNTNAVLQRKTELVEISAQDSSPTLASAMASALTQAYIHFSLQQKTQEAAQLLDFVDRQLTAAQAQLRTSEGKLKRFKEKKGFIVLNSEAQATLEQMTKFESTLREQQSALKEAEDLQRRLLTSEAALDSRAVHAVGSGLGSPVLVSLAERLSTLQVTLNGLRTKYASQHPAVLQAEQQVQSAKDKLMEELATLIANLRSRATALQATVREYEKRLEKLPQAELELANLTRQARVNEETYAFLLKKREETRLLEASTVSNLRIIDTPLPPTLPVGPRKMRSLLIAAGFGLMLGVGLAFGVEYFDDSIKLIEEAEPSIGLPLLGAIPAVSANGRKRHLVLLPQGQEHDVAVVDIAAAEGFRSLRTNLECLDIGNARCKKLAITSPQAHDGKSTVTANLAVCLGLMGQRTLLVDTDLRQPQLSETFGLAQLPGLTAALRSELLWHKTVRRVGDNLHLLPCGELAWNSSELLASQRMRELLSAWEAVYDYILFDAPPVLAVTDPVTIGALCHGVLLVVRANVTSTRAIKRGQTLLERAQVPIVGIVLNGFKITRGYSSNHYTDLSYYREEKKKPAGKPQTDRHSIKNGHFA
jgi:capsular exopolysaccharide synthesis family protein